MRHQIYMVVILVYITWPLFLITGRDIILIADSQNKACRDQYNASIRDIKYGYRISAVLINHLYVLKVRDMWSSSCMTYRATSTCVWWNGTVMLCLIHLFCWSRIVMLCFRSWYKDCQTGGDDCVIPHTEFRKVIWESLAESEPLIYKTLKVSMLNNVHVWEI